MSSLLTVGVAVSCIVMGSFACNYDNSMCESDYEAGHAKGDCYVDSSNAFKDNVIIGACVHTCDPGSGDLRKCEDFCKVFQNEGICSNTTTTLNPTATLQTTLLSMLATTCAGLAIAVVILLVILSVVLYKTCRTRRNGGKTQSRDMIKKAYCFHNCINNCINNCITAASTTASTTASMRATSADNSRFITI